VYLIRDGREDSMQQLDVNGFLRKGDKSVNLVLKEGDCLYLTSNHKITFARDIAPLISAWYYVKRADE
jgi:polysaccharide export outer membrane protein